MLFLVFRFVGFFTGDALGSGGVELCGLTGVVTPLTPPDEVGLVVRIGEDSPPSLLIGFLLGDTLRIEIDGFLDGDDIVFEPPDEQT